MHDRLILHNYSPNPVEFSLTFTFAADFKDVFCIRGMVRKKLGTIHKPEWRDGVLDFLYEGTDNLWRGLSIHFEVEPNETDGATARIQVRVPAEGRQELGVALLLAEGPNKSEVVRRLANQVDVQAIQQRLAKASDTWFKEHTEVRADALFLDEIVERSLRDFLVLRSRLEEKHYIAAGIPWFAALFGRDSLTAALQVLAFRPCLAAQTLRLLVRTRAPRRTTTAMKSRARSCTRCGSASCAHRCHSPHSLLRHRRRHAVVPHTAGATSIGAATWPCSVSCTRTSSGPCTGWQ